MTISTFKKRIAVFLSTLLIALIMLIAAADFTPLQNHFQVFAQNVNPTGQHQLFLPILGTSGDVQSSDDLLQATRLLDQGPVLGPPIPAPDTFSLTWDIQVSFDANNGNNPIIAHWIMNEIKSDGTANVVKDIDISSNCTIVGDVSITETVALFNGGHIICTDLPDFQATANAYTANLRCECIFDLKTPPWVAGKFTIAGNNTKGTQQALITLVDEPGDGSRALLQYEAKHSHRNFWQTNLLFDAAPAFSSPLFSVDSHPLTTFSGFDPARIFNTIDFNAGENYKLIKIPELIDVADTLAPDTFLSWYSNGFETLQVQDPIYADITPTTLYIGANPTDPKVLPFKGKIETIIVDPGCKGNSD